MNELSPDLSAVSCGCTDHLATLFREGGAFMLRCAPECLTEDPSAAAEKAGLRLLTVSLLGVEDPAEAAALLRNAASQIRPDGLDAVLVLSADFPLLASDAPENASRTAGWLEASIDELAKSGAHAVLALTLLDGFVGLNPDRIGYRCLTGTETGLALSGFSKADIGLRFGREVMLFCQQRGMTPDLFELELRERFESQGRYQRPQIEHYLRGGSGDFYPAFLKTPAAGRLIEKTGVPSPECFDSVFSVAPDDAVSLRALMMLETAGLMASERNELGRIEFSPANRSARKTLAALLMAAVTESDSEWVLQAQNLAEALRTGDPNACSQAADALFEMDGDFISDSRPAGYLGAALAGIGLEVTVEDGPGTVRVRLPGGLRELILAEPDEDPIDFGSPDIPRIVLTLE